jgi:hypothetical protein
MRLAVFRAHRRDDVAASQQRGICRGASFHRHDGAAHRHSGVVRFAQCRARGHRRDNVRSVVLGLHQSSSTFQRSSVFNAQARARLPRRSCCAWPTARPAHAAVSRHTASRPSLSNSGAARVTARQLHDRPVATAEERFERRLDRVRSAALTANAHAIDIHQAGSMRSFAFCTSLSHALHQVRK